MLLGLVTSLVERATGLLPVAGPRHGRTEVPFVGEGGHRCRPPRTDLADDVVARDAGLGHEHLVEGVVAVHLREGPNLDTRLIHGQREVGQSPVFGHVPVGAGNQHPEIGVVSAGVPDLLAADDPFVAVEFGACGETRQV